MRNVKGVEKFVTTISIQKLEDISLVLKHALSARVQAKGHDTHHQSMA